MGRRKSVEPVELVDQVGAVIMGADLVETERQKNLDAGHRDIAVRELAERIGYQLPSDDTNPDLIQRDIGANMRRSVEACLEVGRGLLVLKAACPHGSFTERTEALGLEESVARRFMQAAEKFSRLPSTAILTKAIGNQTKLFEMLILDDVQLKDLALTGQTGELDLDDVSTMSVKELRAAVREARESITAKDAVAQRMQNTIRKQQEKIERTKITPEFLAQEALEDLGKEAVLCVAQISAGLRAAMTRAIDVDATDDDNYPYIARQAATSALANVGAALRALAADFNLDPVSVDPQDMLDPGLKAAFEKFDQMRAAKAE